MRFDNFAFGSIRIDGITYEDDVVIDRGYIVKRKKKRSQRFRKKFGYTPVSLQGKDTVEVQGSGRGAQEIMRGCQ
jgi:hypothetical protein